MNLIKTSDGNPMTFYHGTVSKFARYKRGTDESGCRDIGVHFAASQKTAEIARKRKAFQKHDNEYRALDLCIENPIKTAHLKGNAAWVSNDPEWWYSSWAISMTLSTTKKEIDPEWNTTQDSYIFSKIRKNHGLDHVSILDKSIINEIETSLVYNQLGDAEENQTDEMREIILNAGVDVIIYPNKHEGLDGISFVALSSNSIVDVDTGKNLCMKEGRF